MKEHGGEGQSPFNYKLPELGEGQQFTEFFGNSDTAAEDIFEQNLHDFSEPNIINQFYNMGYDRAVGSESEFLQPQVSKSEQHHIQEQLALNTFKPSLYHEEPPVSIIHYTDVLLNPMVTLKECERTYLNFYQECENYLNIAYDPQFAKYQQFLTMGHEYPVVRKFEELVRHIRQTFLASPEAEMYQLRLPELGQYTSKPEFEIYEVTLYMSRYLRELTKSPQSHTEEHEIIVHNKQFIQVEEQKAVRLLRELFKRPLPEIDDCLFSEFVKERIWVKEFEILPMIKGLVARQQFISNRKFEFQVDNGTIKAASEYYTKNPEFKGLYKLQKWYCFEYEGEDGRVQRSYNFIRDQMVRVSVLIYIFNSEDEVSPMVADSLFQKVADVYHVMVCNCSWESVCMIVMDREMFNVLYKEESASATNQDTIRDAISG